MLVKQECDEAHSSKICKKILFFFSPFWSPASSKGIHPLSQSVQLGYQLLHLFHAVQSHSHFQPSIWPSSRSHTTPRTFQTLRGSRKDLMGLDVKRVVFAVFSLFRAYHHTRRSMLRNGLAALLFHRTIISQRFSNSEDADVGFLNRFKIHGIKMISKSYLRLIVDAESSSRT